MRLQEDFLCKKTRYNSEMRKIVIIIVLLLGVAFILFSLTEIKNITDTLHHSNWRFLAVAFIFECLWIYNVAIDYSVLYQLVGLKEEKNASLNGLDRCDLCKRCYAYCRDRGNGGFYR